MTPSEQIDLRLRYNAGEAGFAAMLLLLFGFMMFEPSDTASGWFKIGDRLTIYGMRLGGIALGVIAIASRFRMLWALPADAAVSIAVGLALGIGGVALAYDGGMSINHILYIVFGFMFVSAGLRNGRDYFTIGSLRSRTQVSRPTERVRAPELTPSIDNDPEMATLAERLRKRVSDSTVILPSPAADSRSPSSRPANASSPGDAPPPSRETTPAPDPVPGGFLAGFAPKKKEGE